MTVANTYDPWRLERFRVAGDDKDKRTRWSGRVFEGWKRFGMVIAKLNLYVLLFLTYWTVFALTAMLTRLLGRDWLDIKSRDGRLWRHLPQAPEDSESYYRQF